MLWNLLFVGGQRKQKGHHPSSGNMPLGQRVQKIRCRGRLGGGKFYRYRPYERDPPRYSEHWQAVWRRLVAETDLGNKYAPVLRVIFGKRYMLTQNTNLSHGIANGMWTVVRDVRLQAGREPRWDATEGAFRIDADAVECLIIKYPDRTWSKRRSCTASSRPATSS